MNLKTFRSEPTLVDYARKLFNKREFRMLIEALREEHPKNFRQRGEHIGDTAQYKLGKIDGYDEFENNLLSAATPNADPEALPQATFQPETEETN